MYADISIIDIQITGVVAPKGKHYVGKQMPCIPGLPEWSTTITTTQETTKTTTKGPSDTMKYSLTLTQNSFGI